MEIKGLPQNLDAERFVLGALLQSWETEWPAVSATITADDFSVEKHRRIFGAMSDLFDKGGHIDRVTIAGALMDKKQLESVDGLNYLASLDEGLPFGFNVEAYTRIVKEKATLRRMIHTAQQVLNDCLTGADDAGTLAARAQREFGKVVEGAILDAGPMTAKEIVQAYGGNEFWARREDGHGVPLPWPSVTAILGELRPPRLVTIAARPGIGKTVSACNIAIHAALRGYPPAFFSLEMGADELLIRCIAAHVTVDARKFERGWASAEEIRQMQIGAVDLEESGLRIHEGQSGATVAGIVAAVHKLRARGGKVAFVIVDYLQLMKGEGENRNQQITEVSNAMKRACKTLNVPIVQLAQLNRDVAKEGGRRPGLHDLRDSGSIEQDSDIVCFLHPERVDFPTDELNVEFIVAKHRGGPLGMVNLTFEKRFSRLVDRGRVAA